MTPTQIIFTIALVIYLLVVAYRWFKEGKDISDDTCSITLSWWILLLIYGCIY